MTLLDIEEEILVAEKAFWTAREICQQPDVWIEAQANIERQRTRIDIWSRDRLAEPALRILLCGAGSSSFIGATLGPWLSRKLTRRFDAVSTTDLVGHPSLYLAEDLPTLMVSFSRSGDSPESVAAVELANQLLRECHHLVLTCNPDGLLARWAAKHPDVMLLNMPKRTNDRGFAMTSSYTTMLIAAAAVFAREPECLNRSVAMVRYAKKELAARARALALQNIDRLVVLGAGCLLATAREAALKCLELTNGRVAAFFDTPLGFRHGPKTVIGSHTAVIVLQSVDRHTARYDLDLISELHTDATVSELVVLGPDTFDSEASGIDDFWFSLPCVVFCQMFAFFKARALCVTVDDPCPSGQVNRVVRGVTIHPYAE